MSETELMAAVRAAKDRRLAEIEKESTADIKARAAAIKAKVDADEILKQAIGTLNGCRRSVRDYCMSNYGCSEMNSNELTVWSVLSESSLTYCTEADTFKARAAAVRAECDSIILQIAAGTLAGQEAVARVQAMLQL